MTRSTNGSKMTPGDFMFARFAARRPVEKPRRSEAMANSIVTSCYSTYYFNGLMKVVHILAMLRLLAFIAVCCGLAADAASTGRSPWDRLSIGVSSSPPKVRNELVGGHLYLSLHSSANGGAGSEHRPPIYAPTRSCQRRVRGHRDRVPSCVSVVWGRSTHCVHHS